MLVNEGLPWETLEDQRKVMDTNLDVTMILQRPKEYPGFYLLPCEFKLETQGNVTEGRGKAQSWAFVSGCLLLYFR